MSGASGDDDWPQAVKPISLEDLGRLGIDRRDQLFWDGRPIEVRRRLVLTGVQRGAATAVTLFAIMGGLGGFLSGLNNLSMFLCARNVHWLGGCTVQVGTVAPR